MSTVTVSSRVPVGSIPRFDSRLSKVYAKRLLRDCGVDLMEDRSLRDLRGDGFGGPAIREDALTAAFARQLEYIFKEVYEIEYPALRAAEFIPVSTEVPAGELTFTYRMWDKKGKARIIHNFATDLPKADVVAKEFPSPVITLGASYGYSIFDLQRAALTNAPLEQMKANACRWAIEFLMEQIACAGSANDGVPGMINAPGVTGTNQVSTGGTWLAQIAALGAATPSEPAAAVAAVQGIASDVNAMIAGIVTNTIGEHMPNMMLLPTALWIALKTLPRSPAFTNDTALDFLSDLTGLEIGQWPQLNSRGSTTHGRVMVYEKSPEVIQLIMAQPFTQAPPQPRNLSWEVPCYAQVGGVMCIHPLAITYMDGLAG